MKELDDFIGSDVYKWMATHTGGNQLSTPLQHKICILLELLVGSCDTILWPMQLKRMYALWYITTAWETETTKMYLLSVRIYYIRQKSIQLTTDNRS